MRNLSDLNVNVARTVFDGRPPRYVKRGDRYETYFVGQNGRDDHGTGDDIAWERPRS